MILKDDLTGLPNRNSLINKLNVQKCKKIVLLGIDIKNFGEINSCYGNEEGDNFLVSFGKKLSEFANSLVFNNTEVYRLHSDVFALAACLDKTSLKENLLDFAEMIVKKLENFISENPIRINSLSVTPSFVCGISHNDNFYGDNIGSNLFNRMDIALREAKSRNMKKISYCQIDDEVEKFYERNILWSNILKNVLQGKSKMILKPYYQAIKKIRTGEIPKYECLIRMVGKNDVISPSMFLASAEQLGLLASIGRIVISESCKIFRSLQSGFSINITAQDLTDEGFENFLLSQCDTNNIAHERVTLEILENEEIYNLRSKIINLKKIGFKIAIDDFGVGYSNFSRHHEINIDYIKIDGSLIENLPKSSKSYKTVKSIVSYAQSINAETIAEFVTNSDIYNKLKDLGVDYAQGYAIGKPAESILSA
ncbi:diguanylate cyclase/phosphodiesterase [Flexistipes sinusarabici DSM 4947]|uniref:Diguanylate cyclase/phosphodiesterase n=1 Tax=Flexistipes sinusarabici (strain ATCC 49648 / DSM 4947 / MAS 10) TaxID=717231 RepID=F8E9L6_FLESM|nr:GGDEF domain-containing protein [Flexistipes sinusarabici]AEI15345.1 diguanylate cyclase/phosphodiesterase [Flexistipes sinusarabici DSM 4947]